MGPRKRDEEPLHENTAKRVRVGENRRAAKAYSHWTTSTHAFLSGAAALNAGIRWNGTPWIEGPAINTLTLRKISDRAYPNLDPWRRPMAEMIEFGSFKFRGDIKLYAVFPNLEKPIAATSDCKYLEKWTDKVMIPALQSVLSSGRLQYLTPSHALLVLNSQVERVELGYEVGDTPYDYYVPAESIQQVWDNIVMTTRQPRFAEFKDVFLVAVGQPHPTRTSSTTFKKAMATTVELWEDCLDMQYLPEGNMEIRIESQMIL